MVFFSFGMWSVSFGVGAGSYLRCITGGKEKMREVIDGLLVLIGRDFRLRALQKTLKALLGKCLGCSFLVDHFSL